MKWYYDDPIADVVIFYDRHIRLWTIYPVNASGDQLAECQFTVDKKEAKEIAEELRKERG